jgi:hypothetical protein
MFTRYHETQTSVFFTKIKLCFHKSFRKKYQGMTYSQVRRVLRKSFTKAAQDEIIHYLRDKYIIRT